MISFPILDLVIGMIFIYFLLSIISSSAVELWFSLLNTRASLLTKWLLQIFDKPALDSNGNPKSDGGKQITVGQEIMDHCITTALSKTGKSTTYIDAENFVTALLDKITIIPASQAGHNNVQIPPKNLSEYKLAIEKSDLISGELKRTILSFANEASLAVDVLNTIPAAIKVTNNITTDIKSEMQLFREKLGKWYETTTDRITGTLKRKKAMPATLIVGLLITIFLNVNSIEICKYLYTHPEVSKEIALKALSDIGEYKTKVDSLKDISEKYQKAVLSTTMVYKKESKINTKDSISLTEANDTIKQLNENIKNVENNLNKFTSVLPKELPIGWSNKKYTASEILNMITGWIVTILAISLGAPFWFDLLNKVANLRGTGPKPVSTTDAKTNNS